MPGLNPGELTMGWGYPEPIKCGQVMDLLTSNPNPNMTKPITNPTYLCSHPKILLNQPNERKIQIFFLSFC